MRQGQDDKSFAYDARDYEMARAADLARCPRNAAPAEFKVVMHAASHDCSAGTLRVFEQIHQGLFDQNFISLSAEGAKLGLAPPQDFVQLALCGSGEEDIAQAQATFSGLRLAARALLLRMNPRNCSRLDSFV
jgi:hypothetical protein